MIKYLLESRVLTDKQSPPKTGPLLGFFSCPNTAEAANTRNVREIPLRRRLTVSGRCPSRSCPRSDSAHNTSDSFQTCQQSRRGVFHERSLRIFDAGVLSTHQAKPMMKVRFLRDRILKMSSGVPLLVSFSASS